MFKNIDKNLKKSVLSKQKKMNTKWFMKEKTNVIENDILEVDCLGNSLNCKVIKIY